MTPTSTPTREQRDALVRLVTVVGAGILAATVMGAGKTIAVVLAIIAMIMLHEFGHFVTAKWSGMKVTEFFLGFGPRLWSVRKGETEYGVKAIPAGGYVKIIGMSNLEEVAPEDEPRTYRQQSYPRRMSVALAGSAMHFVIAFVILFSLHGVVGIPNYDEPQLEVGTISRLETGQSPAEKAGFRVGDRLLAVDGRELREWDDLPRYIRPRAGQEITFTIERDGERRTLTAVPVDLATVDAEGEPGGERSESYGFVGIGPAVPVERANPVTALGRSTVDLGEGLWETVKALGGIVSPDGIRSYGETLMGRQPAGDGDEIGDGGGTRFLSPVGFVRVASQAADTGIREVLGLLLMINIFVGVFNLIPLLPLDGGHVAIATYERIRSRRGRRYFVDVAKLMPITYAVFLVLVFLGVTSLYLDIVRPLANPFE